jgi:cytochrome c oxidase subunit IV
MDQQNPAAGRMHEALPAEPEHGRTVPEPHHQVNYVMIFVLLVVLTGVTVAVAFLNIHNELVKVLLALAIATTKAAFVALFFMHLKFEGKLIRVILFVPLCLCVLLIVALIPDIVFHPTLTSAGATDAPAAAAAHAPGH